MLSLRPYQTEAFTATLSGFDRGLKSQLIVLPTGCGKTVVFGTIAKAVVEDGDRVLILAHRGELIQQAVNTLMALELSPAIEMAGEHARPDFTLQTRTPGAHLENLFGEEVDPGSDPQVVVASVQTMQGKRLRAWPEGHFKLVITDEAHHATATSYRAILDHLKPAWHLGVTATWDRGDKTPIVGPNQVFEHLAYEYSITQAVKEGYLARPNAKLLPCDVDLRSIRTTAGDLNAGDLEKAISPHVEELVNIALTNSDIRDRRTIVFTPDCGSADLVASAFAKCGVAAKSVAGRDDDRDELVAAYKNGEIRMLVNCALLTEGFDAPFTDCILHMRPTKSRALYAQMSGRGTRLWPGKNDCLLLVYNWKTVKSLVHPVELFDGPGLDPVVSADAKRLVDSGEESDLDAAIETAKKRQAEKAHRARLKAEMKERERRVRTVTFDPLAVTGEIAEPQIDSDMGLIARASPKMVATLERFGFKPSEVVEWSRERAHKTIDAMIMRMKAGLATKKQVDLLTKYNVKDPHKLTITEASDKITKIRENGWKPLKPEPFAPPVVANPSLRPPWVA